MFQIRDRLNNHLPIKSGFMTATQALKWAKKNLEPGSCSGWGEIKHSDRYYIIKRH